MKPSISTLLATLLLIPVASAAVAIPPVILNEQGVKNLGLETVTVEEADFETTTFALGRTEAIPETRSSLSSRISGRVVENRLKIGTFVNKGEQLLQLESRQPGDPPPTVWLTAPADGTVISVNTRLGAPVEPAGSLAEFADLRKIYLIATLPQSTAGEIRQGTLAKVHFPTRPEKEYTATLLQNPNPDPGRPLDQDVSIRTDENEDANLNTARLIFTIENPDNQLRPGMNAECTIIMEKRENVLSVPREAIQGDSSNRHVYVKHMTIPNAFDRVNIQTGLASNDRVEIIEGLLPGDEVVTRGSYSLGFAGSGGGPSLKEAMDAAHGHEHNEDGSEKGKDEKSANGTAEDDGHDHASHGIGIREVFFMTTTGILALLLVVTSLRRRQPTNANTELS
jgi:multidrug efflux pump subunit AcrA (membrane-fusion protein)